MPIIQVNMLEGRSAEQKRGMVAAVTEAIVNSLGVAPESVRIMIHELHPEHFAVAGKSVAQQPLASRAKRGNGAHAAARQDLQPQ